MTYRKKGKKWINSTKSTVDSINFRSNLEVYMYKALKSANISHKYEIDKVKVIDGFTYPSDCWERKGKNSVGLFNKKVIRKMSYTPDFTSNTDEHLEWIIECKGYALPGFDPRFKIFKKKMMERGNPPHIFVPKTNKDCDQVVEILLSKGYGEG